MQDGQPIITQNNGYWFLGRKTEAGIQLDIENFNTAKEAFDWSKKNGSKPIFIIDGNDFSIEQMRKLQFIYRGEPLPIPEGKKLRDRKELRPLIYAGFVRRAKTKVDGKRQTTYLLTLRGGQLMDSFFGQT